MPELRPGTLFRLQRFVDDGALFYLIGTALYRLNMSAAPVSISYSTLALLPHNNNQLVYEGPYEIAATNLAAGDNLLAVEIHQHALDTSDVSFSARLTAMIPTPPARLEILHLDESLRISWNGAGYLLENALTVRGQWSIHPNQENPQLAQASSGPRFIRLRLE